MPLASVKVDVGGGLATRGKLVGVEAFGRLGGVARTLRQSRMGVASSAEGLEGERAHCSLLASRRGDQRQYSHEEGPESGT